MNKNLIIVGAGGYFREIFDYVSDDIDNGRLLNISIKGVISEITPNENLPVPFLSLISEYVAKDNDLFIIAIGQVEARKRIYEALKEKGASFFTYIHHSSLVSKNASIGKGSIICPNSIINANSIVGENCSINVNCSIGHDTVVGEHSVLSPYSALNGHSKLGKENFVGSRTTIFPKVEVGDCTIIDSHTAVRNNIESKMIVTSSIKSTAMRNRFL